MGGTKYQCLYVLLEQMREAAKDKDKEAVELVNCLYEAKANSSFHNPRTRLELLFDKCRQSCFFAVHPDFEERYDAFMEDADFGLGALDSMIFDYEE